MNTYLVSIRCAHDDIPVRHVRDMAHAMGYAVELAMDIEEVRRFANLSGELFNRDPSLALSVDVIEFNEDGFILDLVHSVDIPDS